MPKRWKRQLRREQSKVAAARLKQVSAWTVADFCLVLNSLSMGAYAPAVKSKQVDGSMLQSLSVEHLINSLGFDAVDAVKLLQYVEEQKQKEGESKASNRENKPSFSGVHNTQQLLVPESRQRKDSNSAVGVREYKSATTITVGAGKAFAFPVPTATEGLTVKYSFTVMGGYDINFQILAAADQGRRKEVLVSLEQGSGEAR